MRRLQLFEFNDSPWCPRWLREEETRYLATVIQRLGLFDAVAPLIVRTLRASGTNRVLDLCSGAGGPWPALARPIVDAGLEVEVLLSDVFPERAVRERIGREHGRIDYRGEPLDALAIPAGLDGMRTLFDAFHHFPPDAARRLLAEARDAAAPIGIFEISRRAWPNLLGSLLIPLLVLVFVPFVRPFRWRRILLTYVAPLLPLVVFWDGLVSHLRAHRVTELEEMTAELAAPDYHWEVGTLPVRGSPITYLLGRPGPALD